MALLKKASIEVLVDVRSSPYSKWAQFANRDCIECVLSAVGIRYIYMGDSLGGRTEHSNDNNESDRKPDYSLMQKTNAFKTGIIKLLDEINKNRVCIMCAEEDPTSCHRNLLVAESLRCNKVIVSHIRGDGDIQTDDKLWKHNTGTPTEQYSFKL
ncbi:MAG: DUF488 domain-containing protein [Dehalococcoidia bacterium]|nr:DUF488 domain-containing protein [Dehalococcoidia bacterium]